MTSLYDCTNSSNSLLNILLEVSGDMEFSKKVVPDVQ